jgi:hypothetical protein
VSSLRNMAMRTRVVAALSLFAFATGNLGALIHQATTTHVRCPEHGELIHGDEPEPSDAGAGSVSISLADRLEALAAAARTPAEPDDPRAGGALPRTSSNDHDHCYISCASRERLAGLSVEGPDRDAPIGARAALALAAGHAPAGRTLYRTAPKTSPPA